ncbi:MAG: hypothetical protein H0X23_11280, partial [Rubrobacter sp.]|nr:hypothetical protein [Rubrobacter sp.]
MSAGMSLRSTFLATDATVRNDSRGSPYLSLKLVDRTGSVDARMWGLPNELLHGLPEPEYVSVEGNTHEYRGTLQVKLDRLRVLNKEEISEEDYVPASELDLENLAAELLLAGQDLENEYLRDLFETMVS